ncbi:MAG: hypothetical protein Q8O59_04550 [bacterium]|nr:hypothetical protein [bacterium]
MEKANGQKFSIKKNIFSLKNVNKAMLLAVIVLGVYYIAGTNDLAIKGFALSDLKAQKNKLIEANNKLELNALTSSSYSNIKEKISDLKMVAAGEVSYLTIGAEAVAKK